MEQNALLYTIQGVVHALLTKIAYLAVGFSRPTGRYAIVALTVLMAVLYGGLSDFAAQPPRLFLPRLTDDRDAVRELGKYALPLVPLSVLSWLNTSVSTLALKHLLGYEATGIFSSALGLASTINIIQTGFNTYLGPLRAGKLPERRPSALLYRAPAHGLHAHALRAGHHALAVAGVFAAGQELPQLGGIPSRFCSSPPSATAWAKPRAWASPFPKKPTGLR